VAQGAHVVYETWVPFEEMPDRVRAAGLTLGGPFGKTLQSQYVVTGKTTQFLACAAPVLVGKNKVSGRFRDKQNCLLVPLADAQAIAQAVRWAVQHPAELRKIGKAGRVLYEQYFSQAIVNKQVQEVVHALGSDRP
jgi:glycosyltransferase involved in cell wall biosynthesis